MFAMTITADWQKTNDEKQLADKLKHREVTPQPLSCWLVWPCGPTFPLGGHLQVIRQHTVKSLPRLELTYRIQDESVRRRCRL